MSGANTFYECLQIELKPSDAQPGNRSHSHCASSALYLSTRARQAAHRAPVPLSLPKFESVCRRLWILLSPLITLYCNLAEANCGSENLRVPAKAVIARSFIMLY